MQNTGRTVRHNAIMLALIVLRTGMRLNHEMFLTEGLLTMLTFERQKVNEAAGLVRTLLANGKEGGLGGRHLSGRC